MFKNIAVMRKKMPEYGYGFLFPKSRTPSDQSEGELELDNAFNSVVNSPTAKLNTPSVSNFANQLNSTNKSLIPKMQESVTLTEGSRSRGPEKIKKKTKPNPKILIEEL